MENELNMCLSLSTICQELGLQPQFLLDLGKDVAGSYQVFERAKRSGGMRKISASQGKLKRTQRLLLEEFLQRFPLPAHIHGCVKGRSIATNAEFHTNQEVVINIDLTDFFGTITREAVVEIFKKRFNCDDELSQALASLMTLENCLPQGAPTSPMLANMAAMDLDDELIRICASAAAVRDEKFQYSRYVDDITISGANSLVDLLPDFDKAISLCGFKLNTNKIKILRQSTRQWVTGMVVNKKLNPPKKLIRKLRQHIYYCEKYGIEQHCEWRGLLLFPFARMIRGQIGYIHMSQPDVADDLKKRFENIFPNMEMTEEELNLRFFKKVIDDECSAIFIYEGSVRKAAPAEIIINDDGHVEVRAFQMAPEQGWRYYLLAEIKDVKRGETLS